MPSLLELHVERWRDCADCDLSKGRERVVIGRGSVPCDVLFIGEAPGESEDAVGRPFVGPAGKLLDRVIARTVGEWNQHCAADAIAPMTVAFTNLVCCIPRTEDGGKAGEPEREHVKACLERLVEFVRLARPRLIVLVGSLAKRHVHGASQFRLDGEDEQPEWIENGECLEFVEIVHPAAILRANEAQRDMMVRRVEVTLRNALEGLR